MKGVSDYIKTFFNIPEARSLINYVGSPPHPTNLGRLCLDSFTPH